MCQGRVRRDTTARNQMNPKFRSFISGQMYYFDLWSIDHGQIHGDEECPDINDNPVMQYAWLKDKNGKDIYQDDFIGFDEGKIEGRQTCFEQWHIQIGEWECTCGDYYCNESGIGIYAVGYRGYHRKDGRIDSYELTTGMYGVCILKCEIIGNRYQNSELLENKE